MVYYEGAVQPSFNPTFESTIFLIDSINQQRKDLYSLTETIMTLESAKSKGILSESIETQVSAETKNEAYEIIINFIKKIGSFIWKLFKNAILYLKATLLKDNAKLLKINEKRFDAIHTDELDNFTYYWREPTPLLLEYLTNNVSKSDDIKLIWDYALQYTSVAIQLKNNPIGVSQFGDDQQTIFQDLCVKILNDNNISYNMDTFKRFYPLKLLGYKQKCVGMEYTRKMLIKESMVPTKIILKLESSLREQQKSVENFLEKINEIKDLPSNSDSLFKLNTCRNVVNVLNNMAIIIANNTIESINVYTSQCRDIFLKAIAYANLHEQT